MIIDPLSKANSCVKFSIVYNCSAPVVRWTKTISSSLFCKLQVPSEGNPKELQALKETSYWDFITYFRRYVGNKLIESVIKEPRGAAHYNPESL